MIIVDAQTQEWCFQGRRTGAPNLLVSGFPCTPTDCCLKRYLDGPIPFTFVVLSSILTYPLVFLLPRSTSPSPFLSVFFSKAPKEPPCHSSSLLFYSLPLVGVQIITFSSIPTLSHLCLESQGKMSPSKNYLETCSKHQIAFGSELPKDTNNARGPTWIWPSSP